MKNNVNIRERNENIREHWKVYTSLYWSRIYSYFEKYTFPKESILVWGWIPYTLYKTSQYYANNRIEVINEELNVYYYVRKINDRLKFFAFVNVMGVKDLVQSSNDEDHLFLKNLYDIKIGIHSIFDHEYNDHCWDALMMKEMIE